MFLKSLDVAIVFFILILKRYRDKTLFINTETSIPPQIYGKEQNIEKGVFKNSST